MRVSFRGRHFVDREVGCTLNLVKRKLYESTLFPYLSIYRTCKLCTGRLCDESTLFFYGTYKPCTGRRCDERTPFIVHKQLCTGRVFVRALSRAPVTTLTHVFEVVQLASDRNACEDVWEKQTTG